MATSYPHRYHESSVDQQAESFVRARASPESSACDCLLVRFRSPLHCEWEWHGSRRLAVYLYSLHDSCHEHLPGMIRGASRRDAMISRPFPLPFLSAYPPASMLVLFVTKHVSATPNGGDHCRRARAAGPGPGRLAWRRGSGPAHVDVVISYKGYYSSSPASCAHARKSRGDRNQKQEKRAMEGGERCAFQVATNQSSEPRTTRSVTVLLARFPSVLSG